MDFEFFVSPSLFCSAERVALHLSMRRVRKLQRKVSVCERNISLDEMMEL